MLIVFKWTSPNLWALQLSLPQDDYVLKSSTKQGLYNDSISYLFILGNNRNSYILSNEFLSLGFLYCWRSSILHPLFIVCWYFNCNHRFTNSILIGDSCSYSNKLNLRYVPYFDYRNIPMGHVPMTSHRMMQCLDLGLLDSNSIMKYTFLHVLI